jgi:alkanesulfonate monooxygenase SsuD/methylene tetrahydromethanopterin reductase-like flavin-dependent oxidoreductase (luciferase family)
VSRRSQAAGPRRRLAQEAAFDFAVISDHYSPWLNAQGHSPYSWSVLGAAAQATDHLPLMTYVTCPTRRYHPAVVAQKAASGDRLLEVSQLWNDRGRE